MKNDLPDRLNDIEQMLYILKREVISNQAILLALINHLNVPDNLIDMYDSDLMKEGRKEEALTQYCPYCGGHHSERAIRDGWHCPLEPDPQ